MMSADSAGILSAAVSRRILGPHLRIGFHRQPLHGLQRRRNGLLIRLGTPHLRIQLLIDFSQRAVVRTNAGDVPVHFALLR